MIKNNLIPALFLQLILVFMSCGNNINPSTVQSDNGNCSGYYSVLNICKWNDEFIDVDSVLMNGEISIITDTSTLFAFLGKPEKIVPITISRNNCLLLGKRELLDGNYLIYGNTVFEQFSESVIVNTIDFESTDMKLHSPRGVFSKDLRPVDIQNMFPESGRLLGGLGGNVWSGNIMVSAARPNGGVHDVWFFVFSGEKLKRMVLFSNASFMAPVEVY